MKFELEIESDQFVSSPYPYTFLITLQPTDVIKVERGKGLESVTGEEFERIRIRQIAEQRFRLAAVKKAIGQLDRKETLVQIKTAN